MKKIIFVLFTFILVVSCDKNNTTNPQNKSIEDLLVKNNEITGWTTKGDPQIAYNLQKLQEYIDGKADNFQKYDFTEGALQDYSGKVNNQSVDVSVNVFNQKTDINAKNTFEDVNIALVGAIDCSDCGGEKAQYVRNGGLSQEMAFYSSRYYVYLSIETDTEESLNVLKQFAKNISAKIKK